MHVFTDKRTEYSRNVISMAERNAR